ncbi:MAG: restriction endonuclease subunit S [Thermomonas sp.]
MTRPKSMAKGATPTLTPKLRFPQFRSAPEWEIVALGKIAEIKLGKMLDGKKHMTGQLLPYLNNISVRWNEVNTSNLPEMYFDDDELDRFGLRAGDVVVCEGGEPGRSAVWDGRLPNLKFQKAIHRVRFNVPFEPKLLVLYLESMTGAPQFEALFTGGGIKHLTGETFAQLSIPFIPLAEQQKITECLSSLDDLLSVERQKLDVLKAHKKGLMQKLFPREGETIPRFRFPEFQNAAEWVTTVGGELFTNRKEGGEAGLPIYSVTINDGMVPRASFDRDFYDIEDPSGNKKACEGDIAYNMMRMWQGAQGVAPKDCMVSPAYVVLAPREGVCAKFFAYFFKLPESLELLTATSRGLTKDRLRLYFDDFARMRMCVPEFGEQQRIVACLLSMDKSIATQNDKLEALNAHKRGLMQQLFPSSVEAEA